MTTFGIIVIIVGAVFYHEGKLDELRTELRMAYDRIDKLEGRK